MNGYLESLLEAAIADEYVAPLGPRLAEATSKVLKILKGGATPTPTPRQPGKKYWQAIKSGQSEIAPDGWEAEAARLSLLLAKAEGRHRLVLSWKLEREQEST